MPEYYVAIVGVYDSKALERKLREVSQADTCWCPSSQCRKRAIKSLSAYLKSIRSWFLYPAKLPCRADPLDPRESKLLYPRGTTNPCEDWFVVGSAQSRRVFVGTVRIARMRGKHPDQSMNLENLTLILLRRMERRFFIPREGLVPSE